MKPENQGSEQADEPAGPVGSPPGQGGWPRSGAFWMFVVSAGLFTVGCYVDWYKRIVNASIYRISGTAFCYLGAMLLVLAYLYRVRKRSGREVQILFFIAVFFALDGQLIQHRFGWTGAAALRVAALGFAVGFAALVGLAVVFRLALTGRCVATLLAAVAFARFAPLLMVGAQRPTLGYSTEYVWMGWLLALCLLPIIALPRLEPADQQVPYDSLEQTVLGICLCMLLVQFLLPAATSSLDFHIAYLAPFVILLGPMLERLSSERRVAVREWVIVACLPYLGIAFSTMKVSPSLIETEWSQAWPLTPFSLALGLTVLIVVLRAHHLGRIGQYYVAAGLVCFGLLGFDFPEALARSVYPLTWQVVCVVIIALTTIARLGVFRYGAVLVILPAFVLGNWLDLRGIPQPAASFVLYAWGIFYLERLQGSALPRGYRLAAAAAVTILPVSLLVFDPTSIVGFGWAAAHCSIAFFVGRWGRDRLLHRFSLIGTGAGVALYALAVQEYSHIGLSQSLVGAAFALLVAGFLWALFGRFVKEYGKLWWASLEAPQGGDVSKVLAGPSVESSAPSREHDEDTA